MADPAPGGNETGQWSSSDAMTPIRDLTGVTLGDFEIERILGRGGMGEVYLARQLSLNRQIAFKILRPDLVKNPTYISRFDAEAWAVAKLNHPNIVHIYSIGTLDGMKYIAMEYVQGTNLKEYLNKKGPLDLALGLSIFKQTAQAIGAAGEIGLVHRDIKPENLLLTKKGQVKVTDFGLCRDTEGGDLHLTQPGVTMGTPMYMSPEQVQGHVVDHRSDLYSLGVTAYHIFTGSPPFKADTPFAIALKHLKDTPVSPRVLRPEMPADLDRIVLKLIEKHAEDRYQSAAELLRDLAKLKETMQTQPIAQSALLLDAKPKTSVSLTSTANLPAGSSFFESMAKIPRPQFGVSKSMLALFFALSLAGGAALGWSRRPSDLLGAGVPDVVESAPALWMAQAWTQIERLNSPESQYRFAQSKATEDQREASWIAVPGYFPTAHEWGMKAYTQFGRHLFRNRDGERLEFLAKELVKEKDRSTNLMLAQVCRGGVAALRHDYQGVLNEFGKLNDVLDPGVLELSLEILKQALRSSKLETMPSVEEALQTHYVRLLGNLLRIESRDYPDHAARAIQPSSKVQPRRSSVAWRS